MNAAGPAPARPGAPGLVAGIWTLFRVVPVLSWSVSATLVGLAAAVGATGWRPSYLLDGLLMLAGASIFQGIVAHGVNDLEDWRSGTDPRSAGILSGGSRVIPRSLLSARQVARVTWWAVWLGLACAAALYARHGSVVVPVALAGLWSAVAYTQPPLRLAYHPFAGELLAGWPAVLAIVAGAYAVLAGRPGPGVWGAAAVQATLAVAWVMQHHLPDIPADLAATPPKVTTPALFARRWGLSAGRLVPAGYFAAGALLSVLLGMALHPVFFGSGVIAGLGAREAWLTDSGAVPDITRRQLRMISLVAANAALLVLGFLYGGLAAAG